MLFYHWAYQDVLENVINNVLGHEWSCWKCYRHIFRDVWNARMPYIEPINQDPKWQVLEGPNTKYWPRRNWKCLNNIGKKGSTVRECLILRRLVMTMLYSPLRCCTVVVLSTIYILDWTTFLHVNLTAKCIHVVIMISVKRRVTINMWEWKPEKRGFQSCKSSEGPAQTANLNNFVAFHPMAVKYPR